MKTARLVLPALAALLFLGCSKNQLQEAAANLTVEKELVFTASLCDDGLPTKTSAVLDGNDIKAVLWSPGDDINVFNINGDVVTGGRFININETQSAIADFSGTINLPSGGGAADNSVFWAFYPYSKDNTCTGRGITFTIPAEQSSPSGTFADGQWPTMARSNGLNLAFYSICSGIMFKVAAEGVTSVTFKNRDGVAINGAVTASWDSDGHPSVNSVKGTDSIVVTPSGSETFQVGAIYFAVLPAVTMSQGIEVTYNRAHSYCTYVNAGRIPFTRNNFNRLFGKDTNYIDIPKQTQEISFDSSSVTWYMGTEYLKNGSYPAQSVNNAQTGVSYSSSNTSVAAVSGSMITIKGAGTTTITATAPEDEDYESASASYTLTIIEDEVFNLENNYVSQYLDDAALNYTDSNWESTSVVEKYCSNSNSNRKDIPAPVTLKWTKVSGTQKYIVNVYSDSSRSNLVTSMTIASSSTTSADIYNLIPGRRYYYTVEKGTTAVKSGTFSTTGRVRMMKVSDTNAIGHAINCRDFGGKVTTDGKTIKYGMLFRGSNMDATTDSEKQYISGYMNVALDIDLRNGKTTSFGADGSGYAYNAFNGAYGVSYDLGNFEGDDDILPTDAEARKKVVKFFTDILSAFKAGKAAYIHCRIGADRTGYFCMIFEALLGVSAKDCSIDFELTSFSKVGTRVRDGRYNSSGLETYWYIDEYGDGGFKENASKLLRDYGVTEAQIAEFRNYMLE